MDYGEVSFASPSELILDSSKLTRLDMDFFPEEFCIISLNSASGEEPLDSALCSVVERLCSMKPPHWILQIERMHACHCHLPEKYH